MGKKRKLIIAVTAGVVLLGVITWIVLANQKKSNDPYRQTSTSVETENIPEEVEDTTPAEQAAPVETDFEDTPESSPAPAAEDVSAVDVPPMKLTVSYVKGVPGFEFAVRRTQSNLQYVAFSSPDLAGTKCTDDEGVFASIIENPSSEADKATVTETKKVGDTTYGLSLPEATCTSDEELFERYQVSFQNAFSLLKELENPSTDE